MRPANDPKSPHSPGRRLARATIVFLLLVVVLGLVAGTAAWLLRTDLAHHANATAAEP